MQVIPMNSYIKSNYESEGRYSETGISHTVMLR